MASTCQGEAVPVLMSTTRSVFALSASASQAWHTWHATCNESQTAGVWQRHLRHCHPTVAEALSPHHQWGPGKHYVACTVVAQAHGLQAAT